MRKHVGARADQFCCALEKIPGCSDGSADAQPALFVFAGVGILELLLDVLDGDQALELVLRR